MAGQPKPMFYVAVAVVVLGLIGFAIYRSDIFAPEGGDDSAKQEKIDPKKLDLEPTAEAVDTATVTTVNEWTFVPSETLPPVKGASAYKMEDNTVKFALNVWAGWAPIIYANNGFAAGKVWKTPEGKEFKVDLVLIDSPVDMLDAYSTGDVHIGWGTLDMLPLFMQRLVDRNGKPIDSRVMPRIYQQVDWSCGGDGIVVRKKLAKKVSDLRGQEIALAESSPSHYFALSMLVAGGVQPSEVKWRFTPTAFEAAAAFNSESSLAAAVSWAPDIYKLADIESNDMLVDTTTANKLIADVWFARADFAKDNPDIIEGLVRGIFDGMVALSDDEAKQKTAELMGEGYGLPASEAMGMFLDAHSTNWAENYQFFVNQNNPANFERVWDKAYYLYQAIGKIKHRKVPFDQVMDNTVIKKLADVEPYASQKDEYTVRFTPKSSEEIQGAEEEILTNTVVIHFYPNSHDLYKKITVKEGDKDVEKMYDPKVDFLLEEIGTIAGSFGTARIVIEGHTDASMKARGVPETLVIELSELRANAVKEALVNKFKELDPNQFSAVGKGWNVPRDPEDPNDHVKNRRVEIKVYPAEAG